MKLPALACSLSLSWIAACSAPPPPPVAVVEAPAPATAAAAEPAKATDPAAKAADDAKAKAEARKARSKELRGKQRELEASKIEHEVAALDRGVRRAAIDAALAKTAAELAHAQRQLAVFVDEVRPRELEGRRIQLDHATHRAEHSKDELGELTAMYDADEFARTTKELVLKRGRRELEMAERQLALTTKELQHFENVTMPERLRELQQRVADAELDRHKAEVDDQKARLEFALAIEKARQRTADLEEDIAELQRKLAEGDA